MEAGVVQQPHTIGQTGLVKVQMSSLLQLCDDTESYGERLAEQRSVNGNIIKDLNCLGAHGAIDVDLLFIDMFA